MATATKEAPARTSAPRRRPNRLVRIVKAPLFARILFPFVVLAFWYLSLWIVDNIWTFGLDVLPTPGEVWDHMWNELTIWTWDPAEAPVRTNVYVTFLISLTRLLIGFLIAMVLGTIIGLAMGLSKSVEAFFHDIVMGVLAMPALAWALFTGLIFGFSHTGPIVTAVLAGIPFVIINVREGVRNTPKELFDMARSFKVPNNRINRHVFFPSMMPFFFAAIRYSFSVGWKGLVIAEVFAADRGAGWTIRWWRDAHRAHAVVAYAFFFVIFALIIEKFVFEKASRRVFRWRPEVSGVAAVIPEEALGGEMMAEAADRTEAGRDLEATVMFGQESILGYETAEDGLQAIQAAEEGQSDHEGEEDDRG